MNKLFSALFGLLGSVAVVQGAIAQSLYVVDANTVTVVFEGTAAAPFAANLWTLTTATKVANPCGLVIFSTLDNPSQQLFIPATNQSINYSALPIQTLPTCSTGNLSEPRTSNFKTPDGKTVLVGQTGSVTAQYLLRRKRSGSFNACGFKTSTIKNYAAAGADSIQIDFNNQSQSIGDLNPIDSLPICRKVGNSYVKYTRLTP